MSNVSADISIFTLRMATAISAETLDIFDAAHTRKPNFIKEDASLAQHSEEKYEL
jgi:hypothetical protein